MAMLDDRFTGTLGRIDGDQKLFDELATYFIEDAPQLLATAKIGAASRNPETVARAVHTLRGLLATFDAEEGVSVTKWIGQKVAANDWSAAAEALGRLRAEVDNLIAVLKQFRRRVLSCEKPIGRELIVVVLF